MEAVRAGSSITPGLTCKKLFSPDEKPFTTTSVRALFVRSLERASLREKKTSVRRVCVCACVGGRRVIIIILRVVRECQRRAIYQINSGLVRFIVSGRAELFAARLARHQRSPTDGVTSVSGRVLRRPVAVRVRSQRGHVFGPGLSLRSSSFGRTTLGRVENGRSAHPRTGYTRRETIDRKRPRNCAYRSRVACIV